MPIVEIKKLANCICAGTLLKIGGVEQVIYELAYKCKTNNYDLTIFYKKGDEAQIERLEKLLGKDKVIKYTGQIIYCQVAFFNYDISYIENVIADKIYQVIHANFDLQSEIKLHLHEKINDYLAVSKIARDGFIKRTKGEVKPKLCYSPIAIREEDNERVLLLITCSRLTAEKGKENMIAFANELDKQKKKYIWLVFTNDIDTIRNKNIIYMNPRLDIRPYIKMVGEAGGYCCQLSRTEGRCTTILEALNLNCPVIVSDIEAFREMGIDERYGFRLPIPLKNIPIKDIYAKKFNFNYRNEKDDYEKYLYKGKTKIIKEKVMKVKIIKPVFDSIAKVHYVSPREYGLSQVNHKDGYPNKPVGIIVDLENARAKAIVSAGYGIYVEKPDTLLDEVKKIRKPRASKTNLKKVK